MSKELALKIAYEELGSGTIRGLFAPFYKYATRYHAAMMAEYGKGFEEWHNQFYGPQGDDHGKSSGIRSLERFDLAIGLGYVNGVVQAQHVAYQAGATSREQELQALREELETERLRLAACGTAALERLAQIAKDNDWPVDIWLREEAAAHRAKGGK